MTQAPAPNAPRPVPLLDIDVLRSFAAIAETGNFTRAARQVFRTPSALSMQIKGLETTLEKRLFVREARRVHLTPDGEVLLRYARRMLKLNAEAVGHFLTPALDGTLRLGTPDDTGTRILPRVLAEFARSHPAVQVNVMTGRSGELVQRLDADELDLALVTVGNRDVAADRGEIVHSEPLVWTGLEGGTALERSPLPIALAEPGCAWRATALGALDDAGLDYRIAYNSEHTAGQRAAVLADLAVTVVPISVVEPPLRILGASDGLPPLADAHVSMLRHEHAPAAADELARHIVAAFRALPRRVTR